MKTRLLAATIVALLALAPLFSHPHFNKTITVALPGGVEAVITYNTTPANEMRAEQAAVGEFITPRMPRLKLSAEVKTGAGAIPAGEYVIGVIKNGDKDWTMALYPAPLKRGEKADPAKVMKLESMFSGSEGLAPHMLIDITPGKGKFEGKAVLTLHFGHLFLAGALG